MSCTFIPIRLYINTYFNFANVEFVFAYGSALFNITASSPQIKENIFIVIILGADSKGSL